MTFPAPVPGLVVRYAYLWRREHLLGRDEGTKDRPCAVLLTVTGETGEQTVVVLPITHSPPADVTEVVEIPAATKRRLGLDDARSWIVLNESNRFIWPGPDLKPMRPGDPRNAAYGVLPRALFLEVREKWLALLRARRAGITPRTK